MLTVALMEGSAAVAVELILLPTEKVAAVVAVILEVLHLGLVTQGAAAAVLITAEPISLMAAPITATVPLLLHGYKERINGY